MEQHSCGCPTHCGENRKLEGATPHAHHAGWRNLAGNIRIDSGTVHRMLDGRSQRKSATQSARTRRARKPTHVQQKLHNRQANRRSRSEQKYVSSILLQENYVKLIASRFPSTESGEPRERFRCKTLQFLYAKTMTQTFLQTYLPIVSL